MCSPSNLIGLMKAGLGAYARKALMTLMIAGTVLVAASSIRADPVPVGGLWQEFLFGGAGSMAVSCGMSCVPSSGGNSQSAPAPPWTFTLGPGGGFLTVTDAFLIGDAFNVFNFGAPLGSTPSVAVGGSCGSDPVPCLANPAVSHAVFFLAPGNYSLTIFARDSPFGAGAAYFRVDAVPEPATMILLGTGLIGVASAVRRRRLKK